MTSADHIWSHVVTTYHMWSQLISHLVTFHSDSRLTLQYLLESAVIDVAEELAGLEEELCDDQRVLRLAQVHCILTEKKGIIILVCL